MKTPGVGNGQSAVSSSEVDRTSITEQQHSIESGHLDGSKLSSLENKPKLSIKEMFSSFVENAKTFGSWVLEKVSSLYNWVLSLFSNKEESSAPPADDNERAGSPKEI